MYCTDSTTIGKQKADDRPIRILHAIGGMVRGGIETWLMHILRHIDRDRFHMDFLVHRTDPCAYDDEIRSLGSRIIPCPLDRWRPWGYTANFNRILREYGPYDVVHSHVHHFSGYVLRIAKQAGVPLCIAHSHNDTSAQQAKAGLYRQLYRRLTQSWISRYANVGLGCSNFAAADLFGCNWESDRRWQILYYGIDLTPFREAIDKEAMRRELGIPSDAFVIGHVGRFVAQKNHEFLIKIAAEVTQREPKMHLLLLGEGVLRSQIQRQVEQIGLSDRVTFAGSRPDIPRLMRGAIDVFLLPSLFEGLPVVGIEAQAAGLPFILSDTITPEVEIFKPLVKWLSLSQPASAWAEIVLNHRDAGDAIAQSEALKVVETSLFNIEVSVKQLEGIFQEALV